MTRSEDYFNWTETSGGMTEITGADLVCKDCRWRTEVTATCEVYTAQKPEPVLSGATCKYYATKKPSL